MDEILLDNQLLVINFLIIKDDSLDSLAEYTYDSDFFGYDIEKIIHLWEYDAWKGSFFRIEPPFASKGEEEEATEGSKY
jgi:hypothetical protein